jgi:parvulin-like peptidyl-prolyl isomerase
VATVNGVAITEKAVMAAVNKKIPLASYHAGISEEKLATFRRQALDQLIEDELLYQEAKRRNLKVERSDLDRRVDLMQNGYASKKAFKQALAAAGLSYRQWIEQIERSLLIQQLQQREISDKVVVTDADARAYYEANKAKFVVPQRWKLRHILISVDPGAMTVGWKAGLEKAKEVYRRVQSGEDFATLAKELSADSTSRDQGGDIGWVHAGQLLVELDEAVRNIKVGDITEPIRTIYGYHLLKLEGLQAKKQLSFEEIDLEGLKERLRKKRLQERREEFLSALKQRADIQIFER